MTTTKLIHRENDSSLSDSSSDSGNKSSLLGTNVLINDLKTRVPSDINNHNHQGRIRPTGTDMSKSSSNESDHEEPTSNVTAIIHERSKSSVTSKGSKQGVYKKQILSKEISDGDVSSDSDAGKSSRSTPNVAAQLKASNKPKQNVRRGSSPHKPTSQSSSESDISNKMKLKSSEMLPSKPIMPLGNGPSSSLDDSEDEIAIPCPSTKASSFKYMVSKPRVIRPECGSSSSDSSSGDDRNQPNTSRRPTETPNKSKPESKIHSASSASDSSDDFTLHVKGLKTFPAPSRPNSKSSTPAKMAASLETKLDKKTSAASERNSDSNTSKIDSMSSPSKLNRSLARLTETVAKAKANKNQEEKLVRKSDSGGEKNNVETRNVLRLSSPSKSKLRARSSSSVTSSSDESTDLVVRNEINTDSGKKTASVAATSDKQSTPSNKRFSSTNVNHPSRPSDKPLISKPLSNQKEVPNRDNSSESSSESDGDNKRISSARAEGKIASNLETRNAARLSSPPKSKLRARSSSSVTSSSDESCKGKIASKSASVTATEGKNISEDISLLENDSDSSERSASPTLAVASEEDKTPGVLYVEDLTLDDEVWLVQCPRDVTRESLMKGGLVLGGVAKWRGGDRKYLMKAQAYEEPVETTCLLRRKKSGALSAVSLLTAGHIVVTRRVTVPRLETPVALPRGQTELPAGLKVRHPLFGADFQAAITERDKSHDTPQKRVKKSKSGRCPGDVNPAPEITPRKGVEKSKSEPAKPRRSVTFNITGDLDPDANPAPDPDHTPQKKHKKDKRQKEEEECKEVGNNVVEEDADVIVDAKGGSNERKMNSRHESLDKQEKRRDKSRDKGDVDSSVADANPLAAIHNMSDSFFETNRNQLNAGLVTHVNEQTSKALREAKKRERKERKRKESLKSDISVVEFFDNDVTSQIVEPPRICNEVVVNPTEELGKSRKRKRDTLDASDQEAERKEAKKKSKRDDVFEIPTVTFAKPVVDLQLTEEDGLVVGAGSRKKSKKRKREESEVMSDDEPRERAKKIRTRPNVIVTEVGSQDPNYNSNYQSAGFDAYGRHELLNGFNLDPGSICLKKNESEKSKREESDVVSEEKDVNDDLERSLSKKKKSRDEENLALERLVGSDQFEVESVVNSKRKKKIEKGGEFGFERLLDESVSFTEFESDRLGLVCSTQLVSRKAGRISAENPADGENTTRKKKKRDESQADVNESVGFEEFQSASPFCSTQKERKKSKTNEEVVNPSEETIPKKKKSKDKVTTESFHFKMPSAPTPRVAKKVESGFESDDEVPVGSVDSMDLTGSESDSSAKLFRTQRYPTFKKKKKKKKHAGVIPYQIN